MSVQAQVLNLLKALQEEFKLTYLFIAHNLDVVRHLCDRVAVMYAGRLVEVGTTAALFESPRHPYTRALHSAVPRADPDRPMNFEIAGEAADSGHLPAGCAFHPRCPQCFAPCRRIRPELKPAADGGRVIAFHSSNTKLEIGNSEFRCGLASFEFRFSPVIILRGPRWLRPSDEELTH